MNHWVMDTETLLNCFVMCFEHYKTDEKKVFVVHKLRNDFKELVKFLNSNKDNQEWHISFNGINFDAQLVEHILTIGYELFDSNPEYIAHHLYEVAQTVIEINNTESEDGGFVKTLYNPYEYSINQIDVYKLNHWDNPNKRCSLKWAAFSLDFPNIVEMPIHHSTYIDNIDQVNSIVNYCLNDVSVTKQIMNYSSKQIKLRKALTEEYNINLFSASEPAIAKNLFLKFLSEKLNIPKTELKKLRTNRSKIEVKDLLLPYLNFKTPEFQKVKEEFSKIVIDPMNTKGAFELEMTHKNVITKFGFGGVHGARKEGIYESNSEWIIKTVDVESFYPRQAIINKWAPAQFPAAEFCEQYEWFFQQRKLISKKDIRNYVYKIILNSTYGLSNERNSFLYDPEFTMRITMNGQLSLMLLYEMLSTQIRNSIPLMQNTDGLEMLIPKELSDEFDKICHEWENITGLKLEFAEYEKMIILDVNNYISIFKEKEVTYEEYSELKSSNPEYIFRNEDDKYFVKAVKLKGRFEFNNLPLHKNKSFAIVKKALYNYFIFNMKPEDTVNYSRDIMDFCAGVKVKKDWELRKRTTEVTNYPSGPKWITSHEKVQGVSRFFLTSNDRLLSGDKLYKYNLIDGRELAIMASPLVAEYLLNDYVENSDFDEHLLKLVNRKHYTNLAYEIIHQIEGIKDTPQLNLF